jgi:hypothetical protein
MYMPRFNAEVQMPNPRRAIMNTATAAAATNVNRDAPLRFGSSLFNYEKVKNQQPPKQPPSKMTSRYREVMLLVSPL